MRDRRIGQHPLDVALRQRGDVPDGHRQDGQRVEQHAPVAVHRRQPLEEDAEQHRERRGLRPDRQERGDRRRRALVHVGRPHVERHRRDLEADAGHDQDHRQRQPRVVLLAGEQRGDRPQVRGGGEPVQDRHPVEQEAEREGPEQEVLHGGLVRPPVGLDEARQDVERQRHRLETDEDGHQVDAARHEHHAERRGTGSGSSRSPAARPRPAGSAAT